MSFLNSPFIKNLEKGELPTIEVSLDTKTIVEMAIALLCVAVLAILAYQILQQAAKSK